MDLRELREDDAQSVADLFVSTYGDARRLDAEEIRSWLRNTEVLPGSLRVLERDGQIVGYGDITVDQSLVELCVAGSRRWETFFDWAEDHARRSRLPLVRTVFPLGHELASFAEARGYRLTHSAYTMEIDLDGLPAASLGPAGIAFQNYRSDQDEQALRAALNEAFADDWHFRELTESSFREFYLRARGHDPSLWIMGWDGEELAGFVIFAPELAGEEGVGSIHSLGVRPAWRRRGLGEALLHASFAALATRGLRRARLGVEADNITGADRLYRRVGMRVRDQWDTWDLALLVDPKDAAPSNP